MNDVFGRCPSEKIPRSQHKINDFNSLFAVHSVFIHVHTDDIVKWFLGWVRAAFQQIHDKNEEEEDTL